MYIEYTKRDKGNATQIFSIDTLRIVDDLLLNHKRNIKLLEVDSLKFVNSGSWGYTRDSIVVRMDNREISKCIVQIDDGSVMCDQIVLNDDTVRTLQMILETIKLKEDTREVSYEVDWTDDDTAVTTFYAGGSTLYEFNDYGLYGDVSLNQLYKFLFDLE